MWTEEADGASLAAALTGSCFRITGVHELPERQLRLAVAQCPRAGMPNQPL